MPKKAFSATINIDLAYERDRNHFFEKLEDFHKARGTPFNRIPTFGGQPLDLYALYNTVISFGGINVVTDKKKWGQVFTTLGFPPCTNAAYALKQHYSKYLEAYERIFFLGEDTEDTHTSKNAYTQMIKYRRMNKAPRLGPLGEPLVDNFNRISFSLQSGLQNEVDFALNICSLLSNVPNSIFNLAKCPTILDLMLGHVGVWSKDENLIKQLYDEWYQDSEKDFVKFWRCTLDDVTAREMFAEENLDCSLSVEKYKMDEKNTKLFVSKDDDVQVDSSECCRINQVCIILYNFSFEQMNAMHLASHPSAIRFLLMSACCNRNNVQRHGLDALDNIAGNITLDGLESTFTHRLLHIMDKFLQSKDKFRRCRAMSILAKLASKEANKHVLIELLSEETYKILVETLYLPDIALILASLDTLYCFTTLDEVVATGIARVHGSIDVLVCLTTVRAETYGNKAIRGYRIIENKHSMFTPKNQQWLKEQDDQGRHSTNSGHTPRSSQRNSAQQRNVARPPMPPGMFPPNPNMPPMNGPPYPPPNPMNRFPPPPGGPGTNPAFPPVGGEGEELVEIDGATYTANWMSGYYEPHPTNMMYISAIYEDYVHTCNDIKRHDVLGLVEFIKVLRSIIPPHLAQILPADKEGRIGISGIARRKQILPVQSRLPRHLHQPMKLPNSGGQRHPIDSMQQRMPGNMPQSFMQQPSIPPQSPRPPSEMGMPHSPMPNHPMQQRLPISAPMNIPLPPLSPQTPHMSPQLPPRSHLPPYIPNSQMPQQMPHSPMPPQMPHSPMPPHMQQRPQTSMMGMSHGGPLPPYAQQPHSFGRPPTSTFITGDVPSPIMSPPQKIPPPRTAPPLFFSGGGTIPPGAAAPPSPLSVAPSDAKAGEGSDTKVADVEGENMENAKSDTEKMDCEDAKNESEDKKDSTGQVDLNGTKSAEPAEPTGDAGKVAPANINGNGETSDEKANVVEPPVTLSENRPDKNLEMSKNGITQNQNDIAMGLSKILNGENTATVKECQDLIEKLKAEMQSHFMQFHLHRQHIQAIQMQIQQLMQQTQPDNLPRNVIKNIQMRVQTHHVQMQSHYQRLQQLNVLSEQVQAQLNLKKANNPPQSPQDNVKDASNASDATMKASNAVVSSGPDVGPKPTNPTNTLVSSDPTTTCAPASPMNVHRSDIASPTSMASPNPAKRGGQPFIVPPPFPYMQDNMVPIQHGIPNGSFNPNSMMSPPPSPAPGRGGRGKGMDGSPPITPNSRKGKGGKGGGRSRSAGKKGQNMANGPNNGSPMMNGLVSLGSDNQMCSPFHTASGTTSTFSPGGSPQIQSPVMGQQRYSNPASPAGMLRNRYSHPINSPHRIPGYNSSYAPMTDAPTSQASTSLPSSSSTSSSNFTTYNGTSHNVTGETNPAPVKTLPTNTNTQPPTDTKGVPFRNMNGSLSGDHVQEDSSPEVKKLRDLTEKLESMPKKMKTDHSSSPGVPMEEVTAKIALDIESVNRDITVARAGFLKAAKNQSKSVDSVQNSKGIGSSSGDDDGPKPYTNGLPGGGGDKDAATGNDATSNETSSESSSSQSTTTTITTTTTTTTNPDQKPSEDEKPADVSSNNTDIDFIKHADESEKSELVNSDDVTATDDKRQCNSNATDSDKGDTDTPTTSDSSNLSTSRSNNLKLDLQNPNQDLVDNSQGIDNTVSSTLPTVPAPSIVISQASEPDALITLTKQTPSDSYGGFYSCQWESCKLPPFRNVTSLLSHMIQIHAPIEGRFMACKVPGCSLVKKPRRVMISHFQEKHCLRKNKDGVLSSVPLPKIPSCKEAEWKPEDESPVTRSVRYTAALILRNIAKYSSYGKRLILRHEDELSCVAFSTSEAAPGAAECLLELSRSPRSPTKTEQTEEEPIDREKMEQALADEEEEEELDEARVLELEAQTNEQCEEEEEEEEEMEPSQDDELNDLGCHRLAKIVPEQLENINENARDGFENRQKFSESTNRDKFPESMDCSPHKAIITDIKRTQVGAT